MASSSVGSDIFALVALLTISLLVLLLLRHYVPLRATPAYLLIPVFLALALPCSIILLVPIDLASASGPDEKGGRGIWLPDRVIVVTWRVTYWLTFVLTWLILPLLGEYSDSGYREPRDRVMYSLRTNGKYQLIALVTAVVGGVYWFIQTNFSVKSVKGLAMALAYAWGLILAVYLMGHGLVAVPRWLFRNASVAGSLKRLQAHAPRVHDKMGEASEELAQIEAQVAQLRQRKSALRPEMQDWVDELAEPVFGQEAGIERPSGRTPGTGVPGVITDRYLAELSRKVKRSRHKKARFVNEWQSLVQDAARLQAILDASASKRLEFDARHRSPLTRYSPLTPTTRYYLYARVLPALSLALGAFLSLASVGLIWSEVVDEWDAKLSLVGLTVVHHPDSASGKIGIGGQIIAAAWLLYMCSAALFSMSEVKVWGNRALVKRQTYAESACWYATQVAKLTVPLSYNFITMMPPVIYRETTFYNFLGKSISLTPLGKGFSAYFPIFVLLPVFAALFNLYGKVKNVIGLGILDDESDDNTTGFGTGGSREGRALIERELQADPSHVSLSSTARPAPSSNADAPGRGRPEGRAPLLPILNAYEPPRQSDRIDEPSNPDQQQEEESESGRWFFQDLGERVRNTLDTTDRPAWLKDIGSNLKTPKWMSRDQRDDNGGSQLGRWFGGRSSEGGLRL